MLSKLLSLLNELIETLIAFFETFCRRDDVDVLVNEITNGKISFAYEGMSKFPRSLVEVLRLDITHLDLSANKIRNFEFLRGFKCLKSLIVDENIHMDMESFPPIGTLELFYANKCRIQHPRSFIFRVSVIFPSIKFLSIMYNPVMKRPNLKHIWATKEHRVRMFAIFINPHLVHFNEKEISDNERMHSTNYHKYLGPVDCRLSKFKTLPDTDDLRKILPVHIREMTEDYLTMEAQDEADSFEEALAAVSISDYFENDDISINSYLSVSEKSASSSSSSSDEGIFFTAASVASF